MKQIDPTYEPPAQDPREEGIKHWDRLRSEYMLAKDQLRAADIDREAMARTIDGLRADNTRLTLRAEASDRECISLRTQLGDVARLLHSILKNAAAARKGDGAVAPFTPPLDQTVIDGQVREIEQALSGDPPAFLTQRADLN